MPLRTPVGAPTSLVITNTSGVIALKLTCPTDPGTSTIVPASSPKARPALLNKLP